MNNYFRNGNFLPIMEHFYTIQGEGFYCGTASYFIRIAGCNVGCHWCDIKESWNIYQHSLISIDSLVEQAISYSKTIVLTGGEPLMYNLNKLTQKLKNKGCTIHIETSGVYPNTGILDWICLSPKKNALPKEKIYQLAHELKIIIYNQYDFIFAEEQAKKVTQQCKLYLQAEWTKKDSINTKIIDYVLKNPKWKISHQTHKYMMIN